MNSAIVLFQWNDEFFRLLRQFSNDPYDAFGIIYDGYFLIMNIYNGKEENIRGKMALSSTISRFSDKKKTLKQFLKDCLIEKQEFSQRIGIQFLKNFLKSINQWREDILDSGKLIVQSVDEKNIQVRRDIQTLVQVIKELFITAPFEIAEEEKCQSYLDMTGDGIETLSIETLLEIRRQIDSEENFSSEWLSISSKINDELTKR